MIGVFYERKNFLDALQKSQHGKAGVDLAKIIIKKTTLQDKIMIQAKGFYEFQHIFISFYAYGWDIDFGSDDLATFRDEKTRIESTYGYLVTIDPNPIDKTVIVFFDEHYKKEKIGLFNYYTIFDTI